MHTKFGCFLPPFHDPTAPPPRTIDRDIELAVLADGLGLEEFWIGEHHSSGWSTLSSPDLFIAALARETKQIRFATGVVPLPYHHPLHTAERAVLLDHLTGGRAILGVGTGTYVHDMEMVGVCPESLREHFRAALDAIQRLIAGETVSISTPWFQLKNAVLQLKPRRGYIETVVASSLTNAGIQLLAETATSPTVHLAPPWGAIRPGMDGNPIDSLRDKVAAYRDKTSNQNRIRCNVFVHIADSPSRGIDEIIDGFSALRRGLYRGVLGMPIPDTAIAHRKTLERLVTSGAFIIGDVTQCAEQLRELLRHTGTNVSLNFFVPRWISHKATVEQLSALAQEVIPALYDSDAGVQESIALTSAESARQLKERTEVIGNGGDQ